MKKPDGKKPGPKRNAHQRAQNQKVASKLRAEGKTLQEIGDTIGLCREQVRLDLKVIDQALLNDAKTELELAKAQTLAKLRFAQIEALSAWRRSLEDAQSKTVKHTAEGVEESETVKGQSGNQGHMSNYVKAVEAEAKLLGLYEIGSGRGDEAAGRLLALHELLEEQRKGYIHDPEKVAPTKPGTTEVSTG